MLNAGTRHRRGLGRLSCLWPGALSNLSTSSSVIPTKTGIFRTHVPDILPPPLHYRRSLKSLHQVKPDMKIKNIGNRNKKYTCNMIVKLMTGLTAPLTSILKAFKACMARLHPYERVVTSLTLHTQEKAGHQPLGEILSDVKKLRAETTRICQEFLVEAKLTRNSVEAAAVLTDVKIALQRLYNVESSASIVNIKKTSNVGILSNIKTTDICYRPSNCLIKLSRILKELRKLPSVDLNSPSVVLVGSPNVGKSSLVRAISSGIPEVADYPFTTRSVSIGHITVENDRVQVIDTPGLLDRPATARNDMEKLTISSMAHIPSVVMFVIDASGMSGHKSTLQMQLNIREKLRLQFPVRPWIDVITKQDLTVSDDVIPLLPKSAFHVSPKSGYGMDELHSEICMSILSLSELLEVRTSSDTTS